MFLTSNFNTCHIYFLKDIDSYVDIGDSLFVCRWLQVIGVWALVFIRLQWIFDRVFLRHYLTCIASYYELKMWLRVLVKYIWGSIQMMPLILIQLKHIRHNSFILNFSLVQDSKWKKLFKFRKETTRALFCFIQMLTKTFLKIKFKLQL